MIKDTIQKYKPGVKRRWLIFLAGIAWFGVGVLLIDKAYIRYQSEHFNIFLFISSGFLFSLIIHHFRFLRIADKNLKRILEMEGLHCIFGFIKWQSYVLILVMISFGIIMRKAHTPIVYMAILYLTIGLALIFSSVRYFRFFMKEK